MKHLRTLFFSAFFGAAFFLSAQSSDWQQHVDYTMDVQMDVKTYQYTGTQKLIYTNNSPDELSRVFYHLYYNAFQPGSEMDIRLQNIKDPDKRMMVDGKSRIASLSESEMGYLHTESLTQDGQPVSFTEEGTILVVDLAKPIPSGGKTTLEMSFKGQVPLQIRRSGRNSSEGVALSMSQWYPKLSEYDFEGWHPNPYIAREFHGVWGDFDVKITLDKDYTVGGSGYLQNPQEIGHGYETPGTKVKTKGKTLTWHFKAPKVHDFMWAADPEYIHDIYEMEDGPTLHFFYKDNPEFNENSDIHVHVPEGATPKDGPSAGIAMVTAIVSSITGIPVDKNIAMTGEVTLRGNVLPIGGLKEKLLAAHRARIPKILIPEDNKKDLVEIPKNILNDIEIITVKTVDEVLKIALVKELKPVEWIDVESLSKSKSGEKSAPGSTH